MKEQEAWARAVGGAVEVDYSGLSIRSAYDVNQAVARTIVKDNQYRLERLVTYPQEGSPFNQAYAYQTHQGGVHINTAMGNGSTRAVKAQTTAGNMRKAQIREEWKGKPIPQTYLDKLDEMKKTLGEMRVEIKQLTAEGRHGRASLLDADKNRLEKTIREWNTSLKERVTLERKVSSGQWSTARGWDEIITHEIGHYYHRRYGMDSQRSLNVLGKKTTKTPEGHARAYDPETGNWTGWHVANDEAYNISEYAGHFDVEFFAEAFAEYHFENKRLSSRVRKFIQEVIETNIEFNTLDLDLVNIAPLSRRKFGP